MGCTNSKLDNEDTVRRCKDRRRLMKQAVYSRHHLAAAHSDYIRSLRLTGSALSIFAAGEHLSVSDETPPVLLRPPSSTSAAAFAPPRPTSPSPSPPPPAPPFSTSSPTITRSKVPHIFSESSPSSTPSQKPFPRNPHFTKYPHLPTNSTYSSTPSQASSVWNWEDFCPPPPPGSDFFRRSEDGHVSDYNDDDRTEREEVHCSDWGDHYSTHSSSISSDNDDETHLRDDDEAESRSEAATRSNFGSSVDNAAIPPSAIGEKFAKMEQSEIGSSASGGASGMRMVVRHRDLAEIVKAIEEYFNKAADAGDAVSDLLEVGRAQFESSFRQLKKTVYHSNSMLSSISSTWTAKPPLAIRYRLDPDIQNSDPGKSHGSTLERLLAWEKKLYQEVKAREEVKIAHEKKLSLLQSQEYRGHDEAKQDKTKASINKLQSLILVTSQAVTTTSSSIIKLRDSELSLQLIELCYRFMHMWRAMNQFHEVQNNIVQQVRGLVNRSRAGESTSDLHRQATRDLEAAVSSWHSSFCRIIKYQRDYTRSLHGWLKLSLIQVDDQKDPSVTSDVSTSLFTFCDEWKQALDRLPDPVASEAIKSFVTVVHSISVKQSEEVKMRKRTETASKDLEKKAKSLRNIEKKFYQSYSMVGIGLPGDGGSDGSGQVFDTRDPLAEKKSEMEACRRIVEDEMLRHTNAMEATRAMTLNNIQTGLPGVFQAMTGFSSVFAEALELVCRHVGPI